MDLCPEPELPAGWPVLDLALRDALVACAAGKPYEPVFGRLNKEKILRLLRGWEFGAARRPWYWPRDPRRELIRPFR